jgi:hypothetical protein
MATTSDAAGEADELTHSQAHVVFVFFGARRPLSRLLSKHVLRFVWLVFVRYPAPPLHRYSAYISDVVDAY